MNPSERQCPYKEPQGELIALESYLKKVETPLISNKGKGYIAFNDKDREVPQQVQEEMAEPYIDSIFPSPRS